MKCGIDLCIVYSQTTWQPLNVKRSVKLILYGSKHKISGGILSENIIPNLGENEPNPI